MSEDFKPDVLQLNEPRKLSREQVLELQNAGLRGQLARAQAALAEQAEQALWRELGLDPARQVVAADGTVLDKA